MNHSGKHNLAYALSNITVSLSQVTHHLVQRQMEADMLEEAGRTLEANDDYAIPIHRYGSTVSSLIVAERILPRDVARVVRLRIGPGPRPWIYIADGRILYTQSCFFARELNQRTPENNTVNISLPELEFEAVKSVMKCLNSGTLYIYPRTPEQIKHVMKASTTFGLHDMNKKCLHVFSQLNLRLNPEHGIRSQQLPLQDQIVSSTFTTTFTASQGMIREVLESVSATAQDFDMVDDNGNSVNASGSASTFGMDSNGRKRQHDGMDDLGKDYEPNKRGRYNGNEDGGHDGMDMF